VNGPDAPPDDRAPDFTPFTITISWAVGDSLQVHCGDLQSWEAIAVLDQAIEAIHEEDRAEAEAEGEEADA